MGDEFSYSLDSGQLSPVKLTELQEELCAKLDELHSQYGLDVNPSIMFRGAIYAMRPECRTNSDWIPQAANSLRHILLPFMGKTKAAKIDMSPALVNYGSIRIDDNLRAEIAKLYSDTCHLAHYGYARTNSVEYKICTPKEFENYVARFERIMFEALTKQLDIHHEIDKILLKGPKDIAVV